MGFYIEGTAPTDKVNQMRALYNAQFTLKPTSLRSVPPDKVLLCVVENPVFDAVGIIFSDKEMADFDRPDDNRPRTWMLVDRARVIAMKPLMFDEHGEFDCD